MNSMPGGPEFTGPATQQVGEVLEQLMRDLEAWHAGGGTDSFDMVTITDEALMQGLRVVAGHIDLLRLTVDALVADAANND